jgi:competence protein ComFC
MSLKQKLKTLGSNIFDLIFPISCVNCGQEGSFLCHKCLPKLERLPNQWCIVCHKPSPFGKTHGNCVSKNTVDGSVSSLSYKNSEVKRVIEIFKYKFIEELSESLADRVASEIKAQNLLEYFSEFVIVPVPLHKRRLNYRGFNQSELLTNSLSKKLSLDTNKNLIHRIKNTKPQTKLSKEERKKNLADAFSINTQSSSAGKFLLVDDVVTTGSTINEMAKVLKKTGASEVWAVSVAHG